MNIEYTKKHTPSQGDSKISQVRNHNKGLHEIHDSSNNTDVYCQIRFISGRNSNAHVTE